MDDISVAMKKTYEGDFTSEGLLEFSAGASDSSRF